MSVPETQSEEEAEASPVPEVQELSMDEVRVG